MKHTKEQLTDILITACEGGINYWARVQKYNPDNGTAKLFEFDDNNELVKFHNLNLAVIRKGLKVALNSEHEHIRFIAVMDIPDALDADVIVQLGLFGEIIYG